MWTHSLSSRNPASTFNLLHTTALHPSITTPPSSLSPLPAPPSSPLLRLAASFLPLSPSPLPRLLLPPRPPPLRRHSHLPYNPCRLPPLPHAPPPSLPSSHADVAASDQEIEAELAATSLIPGSAPTYFSYLLFASATLPTLPPPLRPRSSSLLRTLPPLPSLRFHRLDLIGPIKIWPNMVAAMFTATLPPLTTSHGWRRTRHLDASPPLPCPSPCRLRP